MSDPKPITWTDEKVARMWDFYSNVPSISDVYFAKQFGRQLLRTARLNIGRSLDVLDFGCGPGHMWEQLRALESRWRYTALDFSSRSIESIERRAAGHPLFRGGFCANTLPSQLPADGFDVCLLVEVLEHLSDEHLRSTLEEVVRLVKVGGHVLVSTPNDEDLTRLTTICPDCSCVFHQWQHVRSWRKGTLVETMASYGLECVFAEPMNLHQKSWLHRALARILGRDRRPGAMPHLVAVFRKAARPQ